MRAKREENAGSSIHLPHRLWNNQAAYEQSQRNTSLASRGDLEVFSVNLWPSEHGHRSAMSLPVPDLIRPWRYGRRAAMSPAAMPSERAGRVRPVAIQRQ